MKEGKRKLEALNKALSESKIPNKSTYPSWARYFNVRVGAGTDVEFEAMLLSLGIYCPTALKMALAPIFSHLLLDWIQGSGSPLLPYILVIFSTGSMNVWTT